MKVARVTSFRSKSAVDHGGEVLRLITGIGGSSNLWNYEYLTYLANRDDFLGRIAWGNDGGIIGVLIFHRVELINPLMSNEPHIFLRRLVVKKSERSKGIGKYLIKEVTPEISRKTSFVNINNVGWQTNEINRDGIEFFIRMGFKPVGKISMFGVTDKIFSYSKSKFSEIVHG